VIFQCSPDFAIVRAWTFSNSGRNVPPPRCDQPNKASTSGGGLPCSFARSSEIIRDGSLIASFSGANDERR